MSANKAALLGNATERKIIEHDKALKGLKVKQYVTQESIQNVHIDVELTRQRTWLSGTFVSFTLAAGETYYGTLGGVVGVDARYGILMPFWNFFVDVNNDLDYMWFNGANVAGHNRRKLLYGWKYDANDFDGFYSGTDGKMAMTFWVKNDDSVSHTYYVKYVLLSDMEIDTITA